MIFGKWCNTLDVLFNSAGYIPSNIIRTIIYLDIRLVWLHRASSKYLIETIKKPIL